MSAFHEQLRKDFASVFLNLDEFGSEHELNGVNVRCVVQSPTEQDNLLKGLQYRGFEAVHTQQVIIYVPREDMQELPVTDEIMTLDGETCVVDSCVNQMGMLKITLNINHG
ncbi:hypothetical protein [uncultured Anaerovibrio sp.]|jgi:hypothetical protein|uniref:hypothetical protein n=1 Tax=uncultured Anaerovibrio sp. TaxID=361586 RepID=UPI00261C366B|nr:hypothetical protein [uncultured Anaerovibrio sp.]